MLNNFTFVLTVVPREVSEPELFLSINNTGLKLSSADLLKNFFIGKFIDNEKLIGLADSWDEGIAEKICDSDNTKLNHLLPKFFLNIWKMKFGRFGKVEIYKKRKETLLKKTETKLISVRINKSSRDKFKNFLTKKFSSLRNVPISSLIFNKALQAYEDGMLVNVDLDSGLENKEEFCHIIINLDLHNYQIYKSLQKNQQVFAVLNTYLEYLKGKNLFLKLDVK